MVNRCPSSAWKANVRSAEIHADGVCSCRLIIVPQTEPEYYRGNVQKYKDQDGYGYIEPDPEQTVIPPVAFTENCPVL